MFSLIITLVALGLVVAISAATMFYSGGMLDTANARVKATRLATEVEQIQGAIRLFENEMGRSPISLSELTENQEYLILPPEGRWNTVDPNFIQTGTDGVTEEVCLYFNKSHGIPLVPACNDPYYRNIVTCCNGPRD